MKQIHFYRPKEPYGEFSNFSPHPIELDGKVWPTSEHYFQAQKFGGTEHEERIRLAKSPMVAAAIGRNRDLPLRRDWERVKEDVMRTALKAKFTQHPTLRELLLSTRKAEVVEHTPRDRYWGDGGNGRGKNRLGELLNGIARATLRGRLKMRWFLKQNNILDEPADALICSANVHLTLSGGVGADLLARYGNRMQEALQQIVRERTPHCVQRGEIIPYAGPEIPYKSVLHAVAINGWYESTPAIVTDVTRRALQMAAEKGASKVALTALATGFGRLTLAEFAQAINPLREENVPPIEEVIICLLLDFEVAELARHVPGINQVPPITRPSTN